MINREMVEPSPPGLESEAMASGDRNPVSNGPGATRWSVDTDDPEVAVRPKEFGDAIPMDRREMYAPQDYRQMPNYIPSHQSTEMDYQQTYRGGHRRDVLPEKFAGKVPWLDYYRHFCVCMKLNGWRDEEAGQYLASRLQGAALKVLNNLPPDEPISFRTLVMHLDRRFGPGQEAENFMLELRTRRRQKDESLQQLGQAIRDLTSLAYPEMRNDVRERLAKTHFSEAIDDQEIRAAIFRARPRTLDEAITAALATESFLHAEKARERIRMPRHVRAVDGNSSTPADEKMKKEIQELKGSLNEIMAMMKQMNMSKNTSQAKPITCFACGELGHISTSCPRSQTGNGNRPARRTAGRPIHQSGPQN